VQTPYFDFQQHQGYNTNKHHYVDLWCFYLFLIKLLNKGHKKQLIRHHLCYHDLQYIICCFVIVWLIVNIRKSTHIKFKKVKILLNAKWNILNCYVHRSVYHSSVFRPTIVHLPSSVPSHYRSVHGKWMESN
jgi:hypothetical protein